MKKEAGKKRQWLIALVIMLSAMVLALGSYIIYYKFVSSELFHRSCDGEICPTNK